LQELVGATLDDGFAARLSASFGGPRGCSHLLTLFHLMGSALPRALELEAGLHAELGVAREPGEHIFRRAAFVDGMEIDDEQVGVAIQLADFLTRPAQRVVRPLDRLALQSDARVYAVVDRASLTLVELRAAVRDRSGDTLGSAGWQDLDAEVRELLGAPVMAGLARRLFDLYAHTPERRLLLDCLLQLAPGYIQVMATMMERWFAQPAASFDDGSAEPAPIASVGGTPDSCYMWRNGGAMAAQRFTSLGPDPSDD
jgi:hypothetical protein